MRKKKASFKFKVLIPIMTIFIISVIILSAINYRMLYQTVETKTNANLDIFINSIISQEKHLNIILDTTKQTLNNKNIAIAKSVAHILESADDGLSIEEAQYLAALLDILELDVANEEGTIIYSNYEEGYIGWNYQSTEPTKIYMNLADGTITEISEEPRTDEVSGDMKHYVGVSRTDDTGFIQLGFDANVLKTIQNDISINVPIKETIIGDSGYGMVLSGDVIYAHPNSEMIGITVSDEGWYKSVSSGNGFEWLSINDDRYYVGYKNAEGRTVMGLVPESDFHKELNKVLFDTILFMFAAVFIMITVVYIILGRLVLPIKVLSESLGEITIGNFDIKIEGNYNDEFDIIKDAVNLMAVGIKSYMSDKLEAEHSAYESELAKGRAEAAREAVMESIIYASKIQSSLLPGKTIFEKAFSDYSIIWEPKDIVGGDIYWLKNFEEGSLLCVCDCTGHGTPGALLTMLVATAFDAMIDETNYKDTAQIVWLLDRKISYILNTATEHAPDDLDNIVKDGCDLSVLYVAKDGSVTFSSGNTHVFVCDGTEVTQIKGQRLHIGEGSLKSKDDVKVITIPANPNNKFYVASDGLYDQLGGDPRRPFGYKTLKRIILENHHEKQSIISDKIWEAFECYRDKEARRDDTELITFKP